MASIFSKIIAGDIPGKFVWADDVCVAMATIEPMRPGHVMIVPREETEKYSDVDPDQFAHMMKVSQIIGKAQEKAFDVTRTVVVILGFEVPHTHVHVVPANSEDAGYLQNAVQAPDEEIAEAMTTLRDALVTNGYGEHVPADMRAL